MEEGDTKHWSSQDSFTFHATSPRHTLFHPFQDHCQLRTPLCLRALHQGGTSPISLFLIWVLFTFLFNGMKIQDFWKSNWPFLAQIPLVSVVILVGFLLFLIWGLFLFLNVGDWFQNVVYLVDHFSLDYLISALFFLLFGSMCMTRWLISGSLFNFAFLFGLLGMLFLGHQIYLMKWEDHLSQHGLLFSCSIPINTVLAMMEISWNCTRPFKSSSH